MDYSFPVGTVCRGATGRCRTTRVVVLAFPEDSTHTTGRRIPRVTMPQTKTIKANKNIDNEVSLSVDTLPHVDVAPKLRTALNIQMAKTRIIQMDIVVIASCRVVSERPPTGQTDRILCVHQGRPFVKQVSCQSHRGLQAIATWGAWSLAAERHLLNRWDNTATARRRLPVRC